jgi:hypothetical protein
LKSLEIIGLELPNPWIVQTLDYRCHRLFDVIVAAQARHASCAPNRRAVEFHADFAVRRSQQRRVPHQPSLRRRLLQISPPAKTSTAFSRESLKRNYQAFVRFAVGSSAALSAIALN